MLFPSNSTKLIQRFAICLIALFSLAWVEAQVSTGSILGTVTDPTGAIVSGATITVTNVGTNVANTTQSNDSGLYTVPNLPVGQLRVDITSPAFSPESVQDVILDVGGQRTVISNSRLAARARRLW